MDTLEQPQTLRRRPWMQSDVTWFSVPGSNRQLAFNECCDFTHSLTGVAVPIYILGDATGWLEIEERNNNLSSSYRTIHEHSRFGVSLCAALTRVDFPFSATDAQAVEEWLERYAVLWDDEESLVALTWTELNDRLRQARKTLTGQRREARRVQTAADDERRAERKRKRKEQQTAIMRATPEYEALFTQIYGKPQAALNPQDPSEAVRYARWLVEYRLGIGKRAISNEEVDDGCPRSVG